jgi:ABC-type polysaccharide/polyol phosphate export permease
MIVSVIVVIECFRLGFGWEEGSGPQAGFVPFYLAMLMFGCSIYIFYLGWKDEKKEGDNFFNNREGMIEAIRIAGTSLLFSIIIVYAGVYFAMLIFSPIFVRWLGKHSWPTVILFTIGVTLAIYFGMEVGLRIPLPRSPLYMQGKFII